jgi:hypothetical protein
MRNVLHGIEVFVVRGHFTAAPPARAVKHLRPRIRRVDAIDVELVVMKAFILRVRSTHPKAIVAFGHRVLYAADIELHALRIGSPQASANAPLRVDLRILADPPVNHRVQRGRFEIFRRRSLVDLNRRRAPAGLPCLRGLGHCRDTCDPRQKDKSQIRLGVATLERRPRPRGIGGAGPDRCGIASSDQNLPRDRWPEGVQWPPPFARSSACRSVPCDL